jgi:putative transposase
VSRYIDEHRGRFGVEPICRVLGVSASAYYHRATGQRSERVVSDERLLETIREVHAANYYAYGYRKMWLALQRAGETVGRDRVKRLMRQTGIQGAKRRGKPWRTTTPDPSAMRAPDLVDRDFSADRPDGLWLADFTYLRCWEGVVFFSFVLDAYSRRIVGWQFANHMRTDLVLDALRMALTRRQTGADVDLVHHSDAGSQGGFNRSSQRSMERGCDGREETGGGSGWAAGDALARASAGGQVGASSAVLGGDRARAVKRGCCGSGGCVGRGRRPVVSGGWRDADGHARRAVGTVSVIRGAGGDRDLACRRRWGARDRASAWSIAVDDLEGAAAQRRDSQRRV